MDEQEPWSDKTQPRPPPPPKGRGNGTGAGRELAPEPSYRTGGSYHVSESAEAESADAESDPFESRSEQRSIIEDVGEEGDDAAPTDPGDEDDAGRDLYGEAEHPPEEEAYVPGRRAHRGHTPGEHSLGGTMAAPHETDEEEDEESEPPDDNATFVGASIELQIVTGPDAGKVKRLKRTVRLIIGRVKGCGLLLSDPAVSRRHVEIVQGEKGVLLRDLSSGNGTRVNGEKVTEVLLHHGDQIALGKTRIRFVNETEAFQQVREEAERKALEEEERKAAAQAAAEAQAAQAEGVDAAGAGEVPAEGAEAGEGSPEGEPSDEAEASPETPEAPEEEARPNPWTRALEIWRAQSSGVRASIAAGAAMLLLLGLAGGWLIYVSGADTTDPAVLEARAKVKSAKELLVAERYEEAISLLQAAERIAAGTDKEGLLKQAQQDLAVQKAVEEVRGLMDKGRFQDARQALEQVSPTHLKAKKEREALSAELDVRELEYKEKAVEEMLRTGELESAKQLTAELPLEKQSELLPRIEAAENEARQKARDDEAKLALEQARDQQRRDALRQVAIDAAFVSVARKFHAADYARAAAECDRVVEAHTEDEEIRTRARKLQELIPTFGRVFDEAQRKYKANQLSAAIRPLRKARELLEEIGFPSALRQQILEELTKATLASAQEALARDDLASASAGFRETLELDPGEKDAKEGLGKVHARAETFFEAGYLLRDRDPRAAMAKFKVVMEVVPRGQPLYERAKSHLATLKP